LLNGRINVYFGRIVGRIGRIKPEIERINAQIGRNKCENGRIIVFLDSSKSNPQGKQACFMGNAVKSTVPSYQLSKYIAHPSKKVQTHLLVPNLNK
jgi:hypothetical protein